jgi:hypothetical protein
MSQELIPVSNPEGIQGLTPTIVTTPLISKPVALSNEYKEVKKLFIRPTQWVPGGRPIYRRLPASSESYQVDFFADGDIGYTLIPLGNDQFGAGSMYVSVSEDLKSLLIFDGLIVWEEGTTPVLKAIVNFEEIGLVSGRFLVCYQQIYDDAPEPLPFQVTDYSLAGLNFNVEDSASSSFIPSVEPNGDSWPFPGAYAFLPNGSGLRWKNYLDPVNRVPQANSGVQPGVPNEYQPLQTWISWSSELPWKLDNLILRTPLSSTNLPSASLYYKEEGGWRLVQTNPVSVDSNGYYWQFQTNDAPQFEWKVEWPNQTKIEIQDITVSGILYIETKPSTERTRAQLAIYPTNLVPKTEKLCRLAVINVNGYTIQRNDRGELLVEDIRNIANRDYEPVANWLTQYWDSSLTDLQLKTKTYSPGFMAPPTLLKTSYYDLELYGVDVADVLPPYPPSPPQETEVNLLGAVVSLVTPLSDKTSLSSATVGFVSPTSPAQITDITITVVTP